MKKVLNNQLKKKIDKSDIISFDIFDTLVKRLCKNNFDVFELIEEKYNNKHPNDKISNFKKTRMTAELKARDKIKSEVTIDDIYEEMPKYLNNQELKKLEIEAELEICFPNEEMLSIYRYCKEKNKYIIIVSDMYLDKNIISTILDNCKIVYNDLFLSSDIKLKKSDGSIYEYIFKKYNIPTNKFLHIGDNFKSDYLMAKFKGLKTFWYKGYDIKDDNHKIYFLNRFIKLKIKDDKDDYFKFGYQNLGPLLYGFCNFINENINKSERIFFLSREGKIIKECFDILFPNCNTNYLYVSRKSITSSLINKFNNITDLINSQSITQNETLEMFLKRTGFYSKKNIIYLEQNKIDVNKTLNYNPNMQFLERNFSILKENAKNNQICFEEYLEQMNFKNGVSLVDIGWTGTMQDILQNNLGFNCLKGYYLGVRKKKYNKNKLGYLYNNDEIREIKYRSMNGLLELLFSADHGSTISYKKNNKTNKIYPILLENELSTEEFYKIKKIQDGALSFIRDYNNLSFKFGLNSEEYSYNLTKIGLSPKKEIIELFKNFNMYDEKFSHLIDSDNLQKYIFHPQKFIRDYINSNWKNAFLKNVFKIDLPYWYLYYLLYKVNNGVKK